MPSVKAVRMHVMLDGLAVNFRLCRNDNKATSDNTICRENVFLPIVDSFDEQQLMAVIHVLGSLSTSFLASFGSQNHSCYPRAPFATFSPTGAFALTEIFPRQFT